MLKIVNYQATPAEKSVRVNVNVEAAVNFLN